MFKIFLFIISLWVILIFLMVNILHAGEWTSPDWGYCCNQELTRIRIYVEQQPGLYGDGFGSGQRVMRYEKDTWTFNPIIIIDIEGEDEAEDND